MGRLAADQGNLVAANLKQAISGSSKPAKVHPFPLLPLMHVVQNLLHAIAGRLAWRKPSLAVQNSQTLFYAASTDQELLHALSGGVACLNA